jgi:hypothetical protein
MRLDAFPIFPSSEFLAENIWSQPMTYYLARRRGQEI